MDITRYFQYFQPLVTDSTTYWLDLFLKCSIKPRLMYLQSTTSTKNKNKRSDLPNEDSSLFSVTWNTFNFIRTVPNLPLSLHYLCPVMNHTMALSKSSEIGTSDENAEISCLSRGRANQQVKCHPKPLFSVCHTDKSWHLVFCFFLFDSFSSVMDFN